MADVLTSKKLREERAPLAVKIREMADKANDEKRAFTAEEDANWKKLNADYDALTGRITTAERSEQIQAAERSPVGGGPGRDDFDGRDKKHKRKTGDDGATATATAEHRALALQGWMRNQLGQPVDPAHKRAAKLCGVSLRSGEFKISLGRDYRQVRAACGAQAQAMAAAERGEYRALSAFQQDKGAYTIPEGFVSSLETALLAYANVRQIADVMRTDSGEDMPWPTANDTGNKGALLSENTAVATNVDPSFGRMVLHAYVYTSKLVLIPNVLLFDSAFNLVTTVGAMLGERLGRIQADHFTTGTGAAQPTGIVTAATVGVTAASAVAIAVDELYNLKHSVDPAYRQGAGWMLNDATLLFIKKLKDAQGRYLWQSSVAGGVPDTIDNDPILINQSMAGIATGNRSILYGQRSKYKIRDAGDIRLVRLVERYAELDQQGFVAFARCDANLLDAGTRPVKVLVHP